LEVILLQKTLELCFFSFCLTFLFVCEVEARDIYVRLADNPSRVVLTSDGTMTLTDAAKKSSGLGKSAELTRSGASVTVGKNKFSLPVRISSTGILGFNGRKYRGEFLLTKEFVLINA
jgi:hypothetical protein